jgi:hypothetical protein
MDAITTTEQFTTKAKEVYGDLHNFDGFKFVDMNTPIEIRCHAPAHGTFVRMPKTFLQGGHGCSKCTWETKMPVMSEEEFLTKAKEMHGERYSYGKMQYKGMDIEIEIERKGFGTFKQTPRSHLSRFGYYGKRLKAEKGPELVVEGAKVTVV